MLSEDTLGLLIYNLDNLGLLIFHVLNRLQTNRGKLFPYFFQMMCKSIESVTC